MSRIRMSHVTHMHDDPRALLVLLGTVRKCCHRLSLGRVTRTNVDPRTPICMTIQRALHVLLGTVSESCHKHYWVTSHIRMRHVTRMNVDPRTLTCLSWDCEWVMSQTINEACHTYACWSTNSYMSFWEISVSHVTHMNEVCHTYEWVVSQIRANRDTHMKEDPLNPICPSGDCERIMSHTWMSHITRMNESYHTHERVTLHTLVSRVTRMHESYHTHELSYHTHPRNMSRTWTHASRIDVTWLKWLVHVTWFIRAPWRDA